MIELYRALFCLLLVLVFSNTSAVEVTGLLTKEGNSLFLVVPKSNTNSKYFGKYKAIGIDQMKTLKRPSYLKIKGEFRGDQIEVTSFEPILYDPLREYLN